MTARPRTVRARLLALASVGGALALAVGLFTLPHSAAGFSDATDNTANAVASDSLDPPTALVAQTTGSDVDLSWVATADTYATGYEIWRSPTQGCCYSLHDTVSGHGTTMYTDVGANAAGAPTFESVETAANNGTSIVVSRPAGTTDGDLLVAIVAGENDAAALSPPSGWTQIFQDTNPGNFLAGAWYRVASSEPPSFTFTSSAGHAMNAAVLRYSGAHPTTPIDVSATADAFGNPTSPDVTTTVANTTIVRIGTLEDATVSDIDYPAGTTGRVEFDIDPGQVGSVADHVQSSAGSTGTAAFTGSSDDYVAATIAIAPAGTTKQYYVTRAAASTWSSADSNEATAPVALLGAWQTGLTHAATNGPNRLLVFVASNEEQTTSTPTVSSVSYGGQALTHAVSQQVSNGNRTALVEIWTLDEAGISAASNSTIVPTWTSSPDTALYSSAMFEHVDQATPLGASANATSTADTPNPVPVGAVTTSDGDMVVVGATAGEIGSYTPQNGFLVGTNQDTSSGGTSAHGTAHKPSTGPNETASMLFVPGAPPWINRQVVIALVLNID